MGAIYLTQNANKRSVSLDLKRPGAVDAVLRLVASADIFVENFAPGTAARLGLSFDAVRAANPKILYCSISAYGQDGPIGHRPAYDHVVQGMCGIMRATGTAQTEPNKVGAPYIDYATGLNAAFAIVSALHQVRQNGQALRVDVAMLDSAMLLMSSMITQALSLGTEHLASGNEAFSRSPASGAFETRRGILMIAANNERQFARLCHAIGRADLLEDPVLADPVERAKRVDSLRSAIAEAIATRTADEWEQVLDQARVPAARVRTINEALQGEQLVARGIAAEIAVPGATQPGHVPTLGFKVDGEVVAPSRPPPRLGADTEAVLREAGIGDDALAALRASGAIADRAH
ncbi:MAG: CoA transferase [Burkholderiaceae bacterium]